MRLYRYIIFIYVIAFAITLVSCTNEENFEIGSGEEVIVSFTPTLHSDSNTRAIGDATGIDQLIVAVFEGQSEKSLIFSVEQCWSDVQTNGISLKLIGGRTYYFVLLAKNSNSTAYKIENNGEIAVNYNDYTEGGFAKMEQMDAFYATCEIAVSSQDVINQIELTRPLAQLNFADNTAQLDNSTHYVKIIYNTYPVKFNPFTGNVEMADGELTFNFNDFPSEKLCVDGVDYYYAATNYLFAPYGNTASIKASLKIFENSDTEVKNINFEDIIIEKNKRTNILGNIIQLPQPWSEWDGETKTAITTDDQDRYVIDEASDIAWLGENASTLESDKTFILTKDIDMKGLSGLLPINLPEGSIIDGAYTSNENNIECHKISGIRLDGALFGNATNLTVKNIIIEDAIISNVNTKAATNLHSGILVNTLKGTSSFSNITILKSSVETDNGAAGGMVGYISRVSEKDRNEKLDVSFNNCKLENVSISGSTSEGKFVGLLSGYDNKESLSFGADCDATEVSVSDYTSVYTKANNSAWVNGDVNNKYDGWLGAENYRRAKITFGSVPLVPRWDGKTITAKEDLLLYNGESNKYEVYSPFDLAGVRNATASPAALYLMENVDMNGQGADGKYFVDSKFTKSAYNSTDDHNFNAFSSIALLEGNNNGIYNLALNSKGSDRYAFILSGDNNHIHRNINFYNCCTVVPHVVKDNEDKSYGATVVLSISGATYTMDNIHAYGCKVFALQKTGIIAGRVTSLTMATITNCSVNDCYIENYDCKEHAESFGSGKISTTFYTPGEVGGLIGFIENFATISNCHVKGTTIYAFGQDNKKLLYNYTVYGRHVGQFIGDIRTSDDEKDKIVLTKCTADSNTKCTKRWDKHSKCNMIGCVYSLPLLDSKGTVTLDGKSIF